MSTDDPTPRTEAFEHQHPTERISATHRPVEPAGRAEPEPSSRFDPDPDERDRAGVPVREEAERRRFGGVKIGSAFFGWLTAMGMSVLLTALLAAAGAGIGLANGSSAEDLVNQASKDVGAIGVPSAIALGIILLVAYYCGGYVAGRMARFNGIRQGVAVWLWAIAIALVLAAIGAIAGSQFNVLGSLNIMPRVPLDEGALTAGGITALVIALLIPLLGAILGGLAGMRYHRRIDRALA
ncbi:hypothetical protein [Arthrobacter sp.]|uniref:hypothetical protein n=1 Tax=Arthrobacter sp. TaxID=1667 RepID=UPI003A92A2BA